MYYAEPFRELNSCSKEFRCYVWPSVQNAHWWLKEQFFSKGALMFLQYFREKPKEEQTAVTALVLACFFFKKDVVFF